MPIGIFIVLAVVGVVIVAVFFAIMFGVMASKRQTGHHGPRAGERRGHADHARKPRSR